MKSFIALLLLVACTAPAATPEAGRAPVKTQALPPNANGGGQYSQLLKTLSCPADQKTYGSYADTGYFKAMQWCGQNAPAGHWVYVAPNWYIWGKKTAPPSLSPAQKASARGKYRTLLAKVKSCEQAQDDTTYASDSDAGYYDKVSYCGQSFPAGYWVYVSPEWHIWKDKDLKAIGYSSIQKPVKLTKTNVNLTFEHKTAHQDWARTNLGYVAQSLQDLEDFTGIPYPGANPYPIEERPDLDLLGKAGPSGMFLKSPPAGTPWTFLHEAVHIWNAGHEPAWVREGLANFLSFLLMRKHKYPFVGQETYPVLIAQWQEIQNSDEDLPLDENYDHLPQGKAMAWWAMVYERFGPDFIQAVLKATAADEKLDIPEIEALLKQRGVSDPGLLLDGWIRPGKYRLQRSSDLGPVRYPLPDAWPKQ
jgi:hypothetical protein